MALVKAKDLVKNKIPHFNPIIANGIVTEQFKELESYFVKILKEVSASFPPNLKFLGFRRCTPNEEASFVIENKRPGAVVEISETSTYLCMVRFEFEGTEINQPVYLPYVEKGGQLWIRGVLNTIIPVLTAPVFSVETHTQQIFMKLLSAKLIFKRLNHSVMQDGVETTLGVVWSHVYRGDPKSLPHWESKKDESVKAKHASILYPLCEYGLKGVFERYCQFTPIVSNGYPEFNGEHADDYTVFYSRDRRPTCVKHRAWEPHQVHIAIPKTHQQDHMTLAILGAFFYIADAYSGFMTNIDEFDDPSFWQVLLGKIIFLTKDSVGVLLEQIRRHLFYVRGMLDAIQIQDLVKSGINCHSMVDLLAYVSGNFATILYEEDKGSLYGKKLLVLRNVLEELIKGVNNILFKVTSGKELKLQRVKTDITMNLSAERILHLRKMKYCVPVATPSDNIMFNHTCKFLMQNNISDNKSSDKINVEDPDNHLHASVLEIGSYLAVKRGEPTGRQVLNPYQVTPVSGITVRNDDLRDQIDYIAERIRLD